MRVVLSRADMKEVEVSVENPRRGGTRMADTDGRATYARHSQVNESKGQLALEACRLRRQMYKTGDWNDK